jgi:hypothetical protein
VPDIVALLVLAPEIVPRTMAKLTELEALGLAIFEGRHARGLVATGCRDEPHDAGAHKSGKEPTHGRVLTR